MGNLVFQATLGGQVNLVGPNTASTFNINVPATAGTMVTTGDTGTVTNTMLAGSIANGKLTNSSLTIGSTSISLGATSTTLAGLTSVGTTTVGAPSSSNLSIQSNGTTNATLDTSGNFGLGVTPSAWATYKAVQNGRAGFVNYTNETHFSHNWYWNGSSNIYIANDYATRYTQQNGAHYWLNAASGTAGAGISFTQAMTLNASGNLGVGGTAPISRIQTFNGSDIRLSNTDPGGSTAKWGEVIFSLAGSPWDGSGASIASYATYANQGDLRFYYSAGGARTEAARIDLSGNLLVGTTSTVGASTPGASFSPSTGGRTILALGSNNTGAGYELIQFYNPNGKVGRIETSGSATAYVTSSDYRLKENVAPMTGALAKVAALKPCTYTWKSAPDEIGEGFIAHELAEVCPQAVSGEKDAVETYTDEDGNEQTRPKYQGIDTSFLVATLTAAIQEQQAIIESLTARITALEA